MTTYEMVQKSIASHGLTPDPRRVGSSRAFSFVNEDVRAPFATDAVVIPLLQAHHERIWQRDWKISPDDIQEGARFPLKNGMGMIVPTSPCQKWMSDAQQKFIARDMYRLIRPRHRDTCAIEALGLIDLNKTRMMKIHGFMRSPLSHELLSAFYSKSHRIWWWVLHDTLASDTREDIDPKIYYHLLSKFCYDAVGLGKRTLESKYRSSTVLAIVRQMRTTEEWAFAQLADALQDESFGSTPEEEALLTHYRTSKFFGFGSWIFRATGNL
jgi:hypothetical protein